MDASELDFPLPPELIAQEPAPERDASRLLVVRREDRSFAHHTFRELPDLLGGDWLLVRNTVRVRKARLLGKRPGGGAVECLLLRPLKEDTTWECLLRPGSRLQPGKSFAIGNLAEAEVLARSNETFQVTFRPTADLTMTDVIERAGRLPLPPYIERGDDDPRHELDSERYQTVYAEPARALAAAAPTAGLHFTDAINQQLLARGNRFADLTLEVGLGTFKPIDNDRVEDHAIHRELYEIPTEALHALARTPVQRTLAIGTTSVRSLEDFARRSNEPDLRQPFRAEADLYLYPPADFLRTGAMLTNFHLPRSTLLCLVGAFLDPGGTTGLRWLKQLYSVAVAQRYRFFSYGDAMLIL